MIICAAIKVKGMNSSWNYVDTVVCGHRHCNCFEIIKLMNITEKEEITQGFINHKGEFLDRKEALAHALECGQLSATYREHQFEHRISELYSEDLY